MQSFARWSARWIARKGSDSTMAHALTIIGRRWFQKTYGNTYHTAQVILDGNTIGKTYKHYGYGDQYIDSAFALLESKGLIEPRTRHANGSHEAHWQWAERTGTTLECTAVDVPREKDL